MRILSFSHRWSKLHLGLPVRQRPDFTTFRYFSWHEGWPLQIFYRARSKEQREKLGEAVIIRRELRELDKWMAFHEWNDHPLVTDVEAQEDGFIDLDDMVRWMQKQYGPDWMPVMAKLTLRWSVPNP